MAVYLEEVKEWLYRCGRCGSCKSLYKDYSLSCPSGERFIFETYWSSGRVWLANAIYKKELEWSPSIARVIFACPTCGNCAAQCEQEVADHLIDIFEALRADAVNAGCQLEAHKTFPDMIARENNPYNEPHEKRSAWLEKDLPEKADVLYFVGCTSSYRQENLAKATVKLFEALKIDYTVSPDEWCCGSPLLRTGQVNVAKKLAEHNVQTIKDLGVKTVVTSCAGCYRTLTKDYSKLFGELPFEIKHVTDFLLEKIDALPFKEENLKVTYHDPCHIGRHSKIFDSPRELIQKIPGVSLIELPRNRENAWCCGAGGGVKSAFKDWSVEIATERIKEAEALGVDMLITSCPFCCRNLSDAIEKSNSSLKMMDVVELLNSHL
ncbi:MAG: (Fe-S)-binding protein [Candidatus Helarchaeota archaeon]